MNKYKLVKKHENKNGVSLTFEHTHLPLRDPETFWEHLSASLFETKYRAAEPVTLLVPVFYPKGEHGTHMTTSLCYAHGAKPVELETKEIMLNLMKMAKFDEVPAKEFTAE